MARTQQTPSSSSSLLSLNSLFTFLYVFLSFLSLYSAATTPSSSSSSSSSSSPSPSPSLYCPEKEGRNNHFLDMVSKTLGYASIGCWIIVTLPQIYENYVNKSTEALALGLMVCWILGDIFNLMGCVLTNQLFTQVILALYYIGIDLVIIGQMGYYSFLERLKGESLIEDDFTEEDESSKTWSFGIQQYGTRQTKSTPLASTGTTAGVIVASAGFAEARDPCKAPRTYIDWLGVGTAWASAFLYLGSRIPQIIKNKQRGSVEGLSIGMFILSVLGNVTYALSILFGGNAWASLPYMVGSLGTLGFDFVVFGQFWFYRRSSKNSSYISVEDDDSSYIN